MARTANVEPKTATYFRIGGELIGFKTQLAQMQYAALSTFDANTSYTKYDGYKIEEESIVDLPAEVTAEQLLSLLHKIADNGLKCQLRLTNELVVEFQTRLKQMNYLANLLHDKTQWNKWRRFGGERIGEPNIVEWDKMSQEQKLNFISMGK